MRTLRQRRRVWPVERCPDMPAAADVHCLQVAGAPTRQPAPDRSAPPRRRGRLGRLAALRTRPAQPPGAVLPCLLERGAAPDRTSSVDRPPCCPNRMSVSRRSPTMQIWPRCSPNCAAMLASMNSAGLPTMMGSRFTAPARRRARVGARATCAAARQACFVLPYSGRWKQRRGPGARQHRAPSTARRLSGRSAQHPVAR